MGKSYVEKLVALKLPALSLSNTSPESFSYQIYINLFAVLNYCILFDSGKTRG